MFGGCWEKLDVTKAIGDFDQTLFQTLPIELHRNCQAQNFIGLLPQEEKVSTRSCSTSLRWTWNIDSYSLYVPSTDTLIFTQPNTTVSQEKLGQPGRRQQQAGRVQPCRRTASRCRAGKMPVRVVQQEMLIVFVHVKIGKAWRMENRDENEKKRRCEETRGLTKLHAPWFLCSSWLQTHFLAFLNRATSCCRRSIGNGQRLSSLTTATFAILFSSMCLARV